MKAKTVGILILLLVLGSGTSWGQIFIPLCDPADILTDTCGGGSPLPDETVVYLYWDENANGPDEADTLLPRSPNDPGANYNMFSMNGETSLGVPGTICTDPVLAIETTEVPLRLYLLVPVCDQGIKWTSNVIVARPDSEIADIVWTCETCEDVSSTGDLTIGMPRQLSLHANYPNPFNATTEISFDLPREMEASLKVYDVLGREVAELVNGVMNAGTHMITFDASALSSGVYFYRLEAGRFVDARKMVLLK
ncbi:T9SS type A sorting domain-containing protein [bacterium]|nr:T9SS type A sorting domain-containing protein [bacterium]